ncbi:RagB/SusD family nutrient uptake outer membrane protein [Olivibacter sp. LS-1]|uniref:RagB/SusD family nutrient uptake outer membrane protein n=1 Tax=unclassified Olivibacter TaxID=2632301 RepID=UPI0011EAE3EA|nr:MULTISPECIES: RagB/SusD family nutrient uptake outer membrane protein [unclassified Olivibacter]MDM8176596.1 RagB/SusD family nutrient uptake outer membrane protein [Olivibacter sp. 47]QEL00431.1 RagB/SusD family nutrient uptake outer membrane protein [Olivibacter sp. LS-1]
MKNCTNRLIFFILLIGLLAGCKKFLEEKPDKKLAVPVNAEHFQALLNESSQIDISPSEGEIASADFYLSDDDYESLGCETEWDLYRWRDGPFTELCYIEDGWRKCYKSIYHCNVVLEGVAEQALNEELKNVKGQAHFHRAVNLLEMAGIWASIYDENTADEKLGLPLRLSSDFNVKSERANLKETYRQILEDLKEAEVNLPVRQPNRRWPGRSAALGLLARTYLFMGDFENALVYADKALQGVSLLDFNEIDVQADYPFNSEDNEEVLLYKFLFTYYSLNEAVAKVDSNLIKLYDNRDLRKPAFFRVNEDGSYRFKGSYGGGRGAYFSGIAVDEVMLIKAEALVRLGEVGEALSVLNQLLEKRWQRGFFKPYQTVDAQETLDLILKERRKELLFRGLRWFDVKRINHLGGKITLEREVNGQRYTLPVGDPRFTILIPEDVIRLGGIPQNER